MCNVSGSNSHGLSPSMDEGEIKKISWQILQGVDYCHRNGVRG